MAQLPFVDTHIHYWDLKAENLRYMWLDRDWDHPVLGRAFGNIGTTRASGFENAAPCLAVHRRTPHQFATRMC